MKDDEMNEVHNQIIGWTNNCDTKSSIILAFIGVLVSIAFTSDYILQTIESQIQNIICYWNDGIGSFSLPATLMFLFLLSFTILIGVSSVYSIAALTANIKCKDDSIIFFGKITTKTKEEYIEQAQNISDEEYKKDKLIQIYNCSKICDNKFLCYNHSIAYLRYSLLSFVGFVLSVIIINAIN